MPKIQVPSLPRVPSKVKIDFERHEVHALGKIIDFRNMEFLLLATLTKADGRVLSRQELLATVWKIKADIDTRRVDQHICRIKRKLGKAADILVTVSGRGYKVRGAEVVA